MYIRSLKQKKGSHSRPSRVRGHLTDRGDTLNELLAVQRLFRVGHMHAGGCVVKRVSDLISCSSQLKETRLMKIQSSSHNRGMKPLQVMTTATAIKRYLS